MTPSYSLVATVRNEAATIGAFVDSLLAQTRPPDEILIVDGASTDGTLALLQAYAARGALQVVSRPCNIAEGRNLAIGLAKGSHIAVTDAGCRVDPGWLDALARRFEAEDRPDVVAGNFRFETHTPFEEAVVRATFPPDRDASEAARYYPSSRSVAFRKAAWAAAGGYPEWLKVAEDTLFNIRLRQVGMRFAFASEAIVWWRPRPTWRALARQRIDFARGNARVGIGTPAYWLNLRVHALALALLASAPLWPLWPLALAGAAAVLGWHGRRHLWPQARRATRGQGWRSTLRVLAVMEFVRLVSLWGFLRGRWDRLTDPRFLREQQRYMGVASVQQLDWA